MGFRERLERLSERVPRWQEQMVRYARVQLQLGKPKSQIKELIVDRFSVDPDVANVVIAAAEQKEESFSEVSPEWVEQNFSKDFLDWVLKAGHNLEAETDGDMMQLYSQYKREKGMPLFEKGACKETIAKRGDKWCVLHGHPQKPGSKTDKPAGSVIACHDSKKDAIAQHVAIMMSQKRRGESLAESDGAFKQIQDKLKQGETEKTIFSWLVNERGFPINAARALISEAKSRMESFKEKRDVPSPKERKENPYDFHCKKCGALLGTADRKYKCPECGFVDFGESLKEKYGNKRESFTENDKPPVCSICKKKIPVRQLPAEPKKAIYYDVKGIGEVCESCADKLRRQKNPPSMQLGWWEPDYDPNWGLFKDESLKEGDPRLYRGRNKWQSLDESGKVKFLQVIGYFPSEKTKAWAKLSWESLPADIQKDLDGYLKHGAFDPANVTLIESIVTKCESAVPDDLVVKVVKFLAMNPDPTDEMVHELADQIGIPVPDIEAAIYKIASKFIKGLFGIENLREQSPVEDYQAIAQQLFKKSPKDLTPEETKKVDEEFEKSYARAMSQKFTERSESNEFWWTNILSMEEKEEMLQSVHADKSLAARSWSEVPSDTQKQLVDYSTQVITEKKEGVSSVLNRMWRALAYGESKR